MPKIIIDDIEKNQAAWLEQKKKSIGSGEIASISGSGFLTPLQLWAIRTGKEKAPEPTNYMRWGQLMEEPIAKMIAEKEGGKLVKNTILWGHDEVSYAVATPDYFLDGLILEIKNVSYLASEAWDDGPPIGVKIQVTWQMGILGQKAALVGALIGGDINKLHVYRIPFSGYVFDQLLALSKDFMKMVEEEIPPNAMTSDIGLVSKLGPSLPECENVDKIDQLIPLYNHFKEKADELAAQMKIYHDKAQEARANIRLLMGSTNKVSVSNYIVESRAINVSAKQVGAYSYDRFYIRKKA